MSANVAMQFNARSLSHAERRATLYHELVHNALTPKLYALRGLRGTISQNGYANSHLLRCLKEAMGETYALLRTNRCQRAC